MSWAEFLTFDGKWNEMEQQRKMVKMKHLNMKMRKERIKDQEVKHLCDTEWNIKQPYKKDGRDYEKNENWEHWMAWMAKWKRSNEEREKKSNKIKRENIKEWENTVSKRCVKVSWGVRSK